MGKSRGKEMHLQLSLLLGGIYNNEQLKCRLTTYSCHGTPESWVINGRMGPELEMEGTPRDCNCGFNYTQRSGTELSRLKSQKRNWTKELGRHQPEVMKCLYSEELIIWS